MDRQIIPFCLLIFFIYTVFTSVSSAVVETSKPRASSPASKLKTSELQPDVDAIIYPTDIVRGGGVSEKLGDSESSIKPPSPCPEDALFCESADDYPKDFIKKNLKKQPKFLLDVFYEEKHQYKRSTKSNDTQEVCERLSIPDSLKKSMREIEDAHNKLGPDVGIEKELCTSSTRVVYPNKAKSKEGVYEFVVNDEENKQGVVVETCTNQGEQCKELPTEILPLGYQTSCVQKTITKVLVVFNSTTNAQGFVTKPFEFPSCCSCVITMSVPNYDRFGDTNTTPANTTKRITAGTTEKPRSNN